MGREADTGCGTGPVAARRAQDLRIGDQVMRGDHLMTVTSTRLQGVRGGTVSVGFLEMGERVTFGPNDLIDIHEPIRDVRKGSRSNGRW